MVRNLLPIQFGNAWFAVDAGLVVEVLGTQNWVVIPGARSSLPGVVVWRGRAAALLDFGSLSGVCPPLDKSRPPRRTVMLHTTAGTLAVPVDNVKEVLTVADKQIRPPHVVSGEFVLGEFEVEGISTAILDLKAVLVHVSVETDVSGAATKGS